MRVGTPEVCLVQSTYFVSCITLQGGVICAKSKNGRANARNVPSGSEPHMCNYYISFERFLDIQDK
jgi:hypothetical protein